MWKRSYIQLPVSSITFTLIHFAQLKGHKMHENQLEKAAVMHSIWTFHLGMGMEASVICHSKECWYRFFLVKDKFTGVLQLYAIPVFTFISIKIIRYFSCVTRTAPLMTSPLAITQTTKLSSVTFAISFCSLLHNHHSFLQMESIKAPPHICQQ